MRILLVDDHESTLLALRIALAGGNCDVTTAAGGEKALQRLRETQFDWLITDAQMEPMTGFELSVKAKRLQPNIRSVMISGVYDGRDLGNFPLEKLFAKPVDVDALREFLAT